MKIRIIMMILTLSLSYGIPYHRRNKWKMKYLNRILNVMMNILRMVRFMK